MKRIALIAVVMIGGCEEQNQQPSLAVQKMTEACQNNDMNACQALDARERQKAAMMAAYMGQVQANNTAMMNANTALWARTQMPTTQSVRVQTTCQTYFGITSCN